MYYIYKHYNKDLEVIYCGKTMRMNDRQREHLKKSIWKDDIYKITFCEVENKTIMDLYEVYLINTLNPKYNTQDKRNDDLNCINFKDYDFIDYNVNLDELRYVRKFKKKPKSLSFDYYGKYICLLELADKDGNIEYEKDKIMKIFDLKSSAFDTFIKALIDNNLIQKKNKNIHIL